MKTFPICAAYHSSHGNIKKKKKLIRPFPQLPQLTQAAWV